MADLTGVLADLAAENESLDALVARLPAADWRTPTPAKGWTVAHQIGHLAWTDDIAALAATDAAGFAAALTSAVAEFDGYVDRAAAERAIREPVELVASWRRGRQALADALAVTPPGTKLPWFGPPMSATSMATARLMETWAHGQDIADALGVRREPSARLKHVAHIGVRALAYSYVVRGLPVPEVPIRIELVAPDGSAWTWGPTGAVDRVSGDALDFCLVVTQRRHREDTTLDITGPVAEEWMSIAQAFAGAAGPGRPAQTATAPA